MMKRLLCALVMGGLLGAASGCSESKAPVIEKPKEIPPLPDRNALKPANPGGGGGPGASGTPVAAPSAPEGIKPDPPK
jgi:hypothetical protein